jgi:hypothetical protein
MIGFQTSVIRPQVNANAIPRNGARAADDISQSVKNYVKITLTRARKVATGRTIKSIAAERILDSASRGMFIRHVTGSRSWLNIQMGRRAGGKMPVTRAAGVTKSGGALMMPVYDLLLWFEALNIPRARWFVIMRAIARRGIKPVNIRDRAVNASRPRIAEIASQTANRIAAELFAGNASIGISQSFGRRP